MEMLLQTLSAFASPSVILMLFVGVALGIIGGAMPGISPSMTIALMLPVALYMPTSAAIALLMACYQGAMFGGSVSAILINTPGTASAAATALDGYPMALSGNSKKALQMALYASVFGGLIGIVILSLSAQFLAKVALSFGPPEYFGLMLLSMALIAGISGKSLLKGLIAAGLGLFFATVGMDPIYGTKRFTFSNINLSDGINTLSVFIGIFALSEILTQLAKGRQRLNEQDKAIDKALNRLSFVELWGQKINILISGILGSLIGILPGIGGSTASFMAYATAQKRSKHPELYGTGIIDGVAAAEAANNAVCGGALVPMLTLGVPGDVVTAILSGALIAQGIKPGPMLFVENLGDVYIIYTALFLSIIALAIVGTVGVPAFSKIVQIRRSILLPMIFLICIVGTYASRSNFFDCLVMVFFGVLGFVLRKFEVPVSPLIIAFVIGSSLESNLRRSLLMADGASIFFTRPLSAIFILVAVGASIWMLYGNHKATMKERESVKA